MMTLETVLTKLSNTKRSGDGFVACCPAHQDKRASLSISHGDDGRVLLHCHAGCNIVDICKALDIEKKDLFPTDRKPPQRSRKKIVATYDYCDQDGNLVYQIVRYEPKDFRQRRPDGKGGWVWNMKGIKRILYRLPEIVAADPDKEILICEGERDADLLHDLGYVATTAPQGAGKWSKVDDSPLKHRLVAILGDNDEAGKKHQIEIAASLFPKAAGVSILLLTALPPGGDISDYLQTGDPKERMAELKPYFMCYCPDTEDDFSDLFADDADAENTKDSRENQATKLVMLATKARLFHVPGTDSASYVTISAQDHDENWRLKSKNFREWLCGQYWSAYKKAPGSQAVQDALNVLSAMAKFDGPEQQVFVRLAEHDNNIYLDLCNDRWECVEITPQGWRVVKEAPVKFRRSRSMLTLPCPVSSGSLDELRPFINYGTEDNWILIVAWLIAALRPSGPYPVLGVHGEQGSAKSTLCRLLRNLIDPSASSLRSQPRETRDLMIHASNSWVLSFDNLSIIKEWLSDCFCRLATGGGFGTRELYTDNEEIIFDAQRPLLLNGISELATRSDLLDRCVCVTLPRIGDDQRKTEREFWGQFHEIRPRILGALLDAISCGLRNASQTRMDRIPRMADFAQWIVAAEPAFPWERGAFLSAYQGNREQADETAVEAAIIGPVLLGFLDMRKRWTGTATELLSVLEQYADDKINKRKEWPANSRSLSVALRRIAPNLRRLGVAVEFLHDKGVRLIKLEYGGNFASFASEVAHSRRADANNANDANIPSCSNGPQLSWSGA